MSKRVEVTSENFGDLLIKGLEEAVAVEGGRLKPARVSRRKITAREADIAPPPEYSPGDVRRVRSEIGVSQAVFASMLSVSKGTVSAWEQGEREPDGSNRRLLQVAEHHPDVLFMTFDKSRDSLGEKRASTAARVGGRASKAKVRANR